MSIAGAFNGVFTIFTLFLVGILATKTKVLTKEHNKFCSTFLMKYVIPANLFENATRNVTPEFLKETGWLLLVPFLIQGINLLLAQLCTRLFKIEQNKKGVFNAIFAMTNTVTIGIPICLAIYGDKSTPFVTACYFANTVYFWFITVPLLARDGTGNVPKTRDRLKQIALSPLLFFVIGSFFGLTGITLPSFLTSAAAQLGAVMTPLSAVVIGHLFASLGKNAFKANRLIWLGLLGRCLLCPLVAVIVCLVLQLPPFAAGVFIIISAMPVMNQTVIMAGYYGADDNSAAQALGMSLIFSLALVPALVALLNLLFV